MANDLLTRILRQGHSDNIKIAPSTDGSVKYSMNHHLWRGDGFNSKLATAAESTVTLIGDVGVDKSVSILINEAGGNSFVVKATNNNTTVVDGAGILTQAINGAIGSSTNTKGYTATLVGDVVTIKGKPGVPFTLLAGEGFGGAGNPALPVIAQTKTAVCPGNLPAGRIIITDIVANYGKSNLDGSVANEPNKIVSLPTGSPTSSVVGLSVADNFIYNEANPDCCGVEPIVDTKNCHQCIHWIRLEPGNPQQGKVTLETVPGDTVPANIIGAPISFRELATPNNPTIGRVSIGAPVGDNNRKLAKNIANGAQFVITGIIDAATNQYFIGVNV